MTRNCSNSIFLLIGWCFTFSVACGTRHAGACQDQSTLQQVRSLISNKCFACHGPDEKARKADLRLDTFEGATESAIQPGSPDESDLIERIISDDPDVVMPPPSHGKALTKSEQQLLHDWIGDGAKFSKHWSYIKPIRPNVPQFDDDSANRWIKNPIDAFTLARMRQQKLTTSATADRETILRRLALDITGLPPTLKEVQQFIDDDSDDAYEKMGR